MNGPGEKASSRYSLWRGIAVFFVLLGMLAWVNELVSGLGSTGMRGVISWGLYICCFAFFVKLSAGGLIVASSAEIFGIEGLKPLARLGALTAAVCISLAAISLIPDLGRPGRIINLVLHPNWRSPMIWDAAIVLLYFLLAAGELRLMSRRPVTEQLSRRLRILAFVGLPAAFALHSITAWIFGLQISRPFWNTALMAPLFVVSAILSGTALISIILSLLQKFAGVVVETSTWRKLSGLMAISLAIELFFLFSEYLTILWAKVPNEVVTLKMILPGGQFAALFWVEWILGGLIPLLLLLMPNTRKHVGTVVTSAGLILLGVFAFQFELTVVGMANPLIQLAPGMSLGTYRDGHSVFQFVGDYAPTWVEYSIVLGLLAAGGLAVTLGFRRIAFEELRPEIGKSGDIQKVVEA